MHSESRLEFLIRKNSFLIQKCDLPWFESVRSMAVFWSLQSELPFQRRMSSMYKS